MTPRLALATLAACHAHATPTAQRSPDSCDAIDAMLAIDSAAYQGIYAGCDGGATNKRVIDVRAPASFLARDARCEGHGFRFLRDVPDVQGMVVRLNVFPVGTRWGFEAWSDEPNPPYNDDGSFDVIQTHCIAGRGRVEWTGERWRAFVDADADVAPR